MICLGLLFGGAVAAETGIAWRRDYGAALVEAQKQKRLLVVHFWLEGRPLVQAMSAETFAHPEVVKLSNDMFINVKVDINGRPELFEKAVGGRGGLATCILDAGGDVVSVLPGYADAPAYLQFLTKAEKGYEKLKSLKDAVDVVKAIMAGASVTMVASVLLQKGIHHACSILSDLRRWLEEHEYDSVRQMCGSMSRRSVPDPSAFERGNYMRVLSSHALKPSS